MLCTSSTGAVHFHFLGSVARDHEGMKHPILLVDVRCTVLVHHNRCARRIDRAGATQSNAGGGVRDASRVRSFSILGRAGHLRQERLNCGLEGYLPKIMTRNRSVSHSTHNNMNTHILIYCLQYTVPGNYIRMYICIPNVRYITCLVPGTSMCVLLLQLWKNLLPISIVMVCALQGRTTRRAWGLSCARDEMHGTPKHKHSYCLPSARRRSFQR